MKAAILGNIAGVSKEMVAALRARGVEADLFIFPYEKENTLADISGQDLLKREWIHFLGPEGKRSIPGRLAFEARTIQRLRTYDVIHSHTGSLKFGPLSYLYFIKLKQRKYLAFATGSDIRELAQFDQTGKGHRMRLFFRNAHKTLLMNNDMVTFVDAIGIHNWEFFPFMINEEKHRPRPEFTKPPEHEDKLLCFMMSNLDFGRTDADPRRNSMKMNDRFFEALAALAKEDPKIHAIVLDRGSDRELARKMVRDLGVEPFVTFHPPMTELERVRHINMADVVIDQFNPGSFGLGALETLSVGKPLITYFRTDCLDRTYGEEPPILNAQTAGQILGRLREARDPKLRQELSRKARAWLIRHHSRDVVLKRVLRLYEETRS